MRNESLTDTRTCRHFVPSRLRRKLATMSENFDPATTLTDVERGDVEGVERPLNAEGRYTSRLSETGALVIEEGRHAALTAAERAALLPADYTIVSEREGDDYSLFATVERVVAARVAGAVDRERAAWAAKIVRAMETADPTIYGELGTPLRILRALLAADDTAK